MTTKVSFYLVIALLVLTATMMHPTAVSALIECIIALMLFILRWVAQEEGRKEIELAVEAVKKAN